MHNTAIITSERNNNPILIVDKKGDIGEVLAEKLRNESLVVLVSKSYDSLLENIIHVPFVKTIPSIPDNIYSHIFLIDESLDVSEKIIQPFLKKAEKDNCEFVLVLGRNSLNKNIVNTVINSYNKSKVAILGDIFAKDKIYNIKNEINNFINEIKKNNIITIPGDGTREIFPVLFDDEVDSILEMVFGDFEKDKLFYLFSSQPVSLLKIASLFKKNNPEISLDYIKEKSKQTNLVLLKEGRHLISEHYNLEEKIKKINFEIIKPSLIIEREKKEDKTSMFNYFLFLLSFGFYIIVSPIIIVFILSLVGFICMFSIKNEIYSQNLSLLKSQAIISSNIFSNAQNTIPLVAKEFSFIGKEDYVLGFSEKIDQAKEISDLIISSTTSYEKTISIISNKSQNPESDFSYIFTESKKAYYSFQKLIQEGLVPSAIVNKFSDSLSIYSSTIDFWPNIFGFNDKKTYMVLLQNNQELRPGGGLIDSYAILDLDQGSIKNFKIYDVYEADKELKTHVEPPFAIRRYLPSVHWFLKDSNFNIDFSKGTVASAIFLSSEAHKNVDGIIAVDLSFIKSLLSVVGAVNVPAYNETITSDNLFQVTQKHTEKDFLRAVLNSLNFKISKSKDIQLLPLISAIVNSIDEKHMLFSFNDANMQTAFSLNNYSSSITDNRAVDINLINDTFGINEANLGENTINYFVTRSLSHKVIIGNDGSVKENAVITFKNSAKGNNLTIVNYKNYLRIILPIGANISSINIDNKKQNIVTAIEDPTIYEKKNFTPPVGLEVEKYNQGKNTVYGFLINVGPEELRKISIDYQLPQKVSVLSPEIKYDLKLFKQPGIDFLPYEFSLMYPKNLKIIDKVKDLKTRENESNFLEQVTRDREYSIKLGQK